VYVARSVYKVVLSKYKYSFVCDCALGILMFSVTLVYLLDVVHLSRCLRFAGL